MHIQRVAAEDIPACGRIAARNTFTFTLHERDGETALAFVQEYAQELADEVYGTYNFNWGYYLNSLKQWCETGSGTPFEP